MKFSLESSYHAGLFVDQIDRKLESDRQDPEIESVNPKADLALKQTEDESTCLVWRTRWLLCLRPLTGSTSQIILLWQSAPIYCHVQSLACNPFMQAAAK